MCWDYRSMTSYLAYWGLKQLTLFMHTQYPIARTWIFAPKREKKITRDKRKRSHYHKHFCCFSPGWHWTCYSVEDDIELLIPCFYLPKSWKDRCAPPYLAFLYILGKCSKHSLWSEISMMKSIRNIWYYNSWRSKDTAHSVLTGDPEAEARLPGTGRREVSAGL